MMFEVEVCSNCDTDVYASIAEESDDTTLYQSPKYVQLVQALLEAEPRHLIARSRDGRGIAALPALACPDRGAGTVINSLPFFGSHGGVLLRRGISEEVARAVKASMIKRFFALADAEGRRSATLIAPLFEADTAVYQAAANADFVEDRIGQFTVLADITERRAGEIFSMCHTKTRNMIRKALAQGFELHDDLKPDVLDFLASTHKTSIERKGGVAKPAQFFDEVFARFDYGREIRVFTARITGTLVAALVLLYYRRTVEYFVPVLRDEYRTHQPLTFLIFEAMKQAAECGHSIWNWGGTWKSQESVYRFKSRWGAHSRVYQYYGRIFDPRVCHLNRGDVRHFFPYFYIFPFDP